MPQARPAGKPAARTTTVLRQCCAVWLVLLAVSPFTAPFSVCQTRDLVVAGTRSTRPLSPTNDLEQWWMDGGVVADLPIPPIAEQIVAMSTAIVSHFTLLAATMAMSATPATLSLRLCDRTVLVLRV
jgi:hypothetical protein